MDWGGEQVRGQLAVRASECPSSPQMQWAEQLSLGCVWQLGVGEKLDSVCIQRLRTSPIHTF